MRQQWILAALITPMLLAPPACRQPQPDIRVAVSSNFSFAITELVAQFESETGYNVALSFGSSGLHYAQIVQGAPFDVFFYALGKLVLWSPNAGMNVAADSVLLQGNFHHLAIANPTLAPYGRAAQQVLENLGTWDRLDDRIVRGENVGQAFHYVKSGNAEWGLIAWSLVKQSNQAAHPRVWEVPPSLYAPIEQQAVLLTEKPAARALLSFVQSERGRSIIQEFGYDLP
jgi:molybdate transport system substrate-binding protein